MNSFKVSVITPIYNASQFVQKAVESALVLHEVGEILLIEDGSNDDSLIKCKELAEKYQKIKLLQHPDKKNHGAGASRNLGIVHAKFDFISFLDADDYYLPNRFDRDKKILLNNNEIDGVYNALGIHYYTKNAQKKFYDSGFQYQEFLTLTQPVLPEKLLSVLLNQHPTVKGGFSTDTITVRKNIFTQTGIFNTQLKLGQDTHLWLRMATLSQIASGNIKEAVAIRGVHENNRMLDTEQQKESLKLWWEDLHKWFRKKKIGKQKKKDFSIAYLYFKSQNNYYDARTKWQFWRMSIKYPQLIFSMYGTFDNLALSFYKRKPIILRLISFKNKLLRLFK